MLRAVSSIPEYLGSFTFANLPSASSYSGYRAFCSDLGANGTDVRSNGTRWRPVNGRTTLKSLAAAVSGITNTEQIVLQTLLPVGSWQANDSIRFWIDAAKSGATDTGLLTVRVGTAGTTADTAITGFSAYQLLSAAGLAGGAVYDVRLSSNTSALKVGSSATAASLYGAPSQGAAVNGATTITDASANALYFSVSLASGGATNTLSLQSGHIELVTP